MFVSNRCKKRENGVKLLTVGRVFRHLYRDLGLSTLHTHNVTVVNTCPLSPSGRSAVVKLDPFDVHFLSRWSLIQATLDLIEINTISNRSWGPIYVDSPAGIKVKFEEVSEVV